MKKMKVLQKTSDISEIITVRWKITDTDVIHAEKISVRTADKRFAVDTAMIGFKEMAEYLSNNINPNKFVFINEDIRIGDSKN